MIQATPERDHREKTGPMTISLGCRRRQGLGKKNDSKVGKKQSTQGLT